MRGSARTGLACGLALALTCGAAGCKSSGTVMGKVTYKGETVGGGTVIFLAPGKPAVVANIGPNGHYTATGVPTGLVKIGVETTSARPGAEPPPGMKPPKGVELPPEARNSPIYGGGGGNSRSGGAKYVEIPGNYADPEKSGLSLTVNGGEQEFNIPLE